MDNVCLHKTYLNIVVGEDIEYEVDTKTQCIGSEVITNWCLLSTTNDGEV